MGMLTKSNRNEDDLLTLNLNDMDFSISFDNVEKKIKLNEKSLMLLEKAIKQNCFLIKNDKLIKVGNYKINLKNDDVSKLWLKSFDKLVEYKLILKNDSNYIVSDKGKKYFRENC